MSKSFPLQPLLDLAQHQNEAATKKLGQLNQQHQSAQDKLQALQQFRHDYQDKFTEAAQNGMEPASLRNFQDFIDRLDQAIQQQQKVIANAQNSVQTGRHELMGATRKMRSFDTLAQRHVETEKIQEVRIEQRTQDEQTGRFAAMHSAEKKKEQ
ncbi:MAG: flagellar export protein FliJ [Sideroxydans sp.]|nr:flagellar export protein FliJ [Sideroxydans sp.]